MRFTQILLSTRTKSIARGFPVQWAIRRRQKIMPSTDVELCLAANGFQVVDMKDVFRPALQEEPYTPIEENLVIPEEKPLCYLLQNSFGPLLGIQQCQLITKAIVFDSLPSKILNQVEEITPEDKDLCEKILLKSNLLDAEQRKLPRKLDPNLPGYKPRRDYNIPEAKKISLTLQHMFLTLEMKNPSEDTKLIFHHMPSKVSFQHPDGLVQMDHNCTFMIGSKRAAEPVAGNDEVASFDDSELPDLYPVSPFIHANTRTYYELKDEYALSGGQLKPHTIFIAHNPNDMRQRRIVPEQHHARSLVYAFSFAASYAKQREQGAMGDLKEPVRVNIIHTNGKVFHTGIFQLNTLDFRSKRRNIFWHEPLENIYQHVKYDIAIPVVEELNTRPYQLLRALLK